MLYGHASALPPLIFSAPRAYTAAGSGGGPIASLPVPKEAIRVAGDSHSAPELRPLRVERQFRGDRSTRDMLLRLLRAHQTAGSSRS